MNQPVGQGKAAKAGIGKKKIERKKGNYINVRPQISSTRNKPTHVAAYCLL